MKRKLLGTILSAAAIFSLAACSSNSTPEEKPAKEAAPQSSAAATEAPQSAKEAPQSDQQQSAQKPAAAPAGDQVQPGDRVSGRGAVEFVNYDGKTAVFSHEVTSIELAPEADVATLVEEIPQIKGMQVYYITVDSRFVSGDNLEFSAFYTDLRPADADGNQMQEITLIGWDNCESNSIPKGGGTPDEPILNCYAAAVPVGGNEPAGVMWAPYDTDFDMYNGKPALFVPAGN